MQAAKDASDPVVPKVALHATATEALKDVDFKDLKRYALDPETAGAVQSGLPRGMAGSKVHEADTAGGSVRSQHPTVEEHPDKSTYPKVPGKQ